MTQIAGVLLKLPDGQVVLNRRDHSGFADEGLLALYGGHIEDGETPKIAAARELAEESSLKFNQYELKFLAEINFKVETGLKTFHVFGLDIKSEEFEVYEGVGSEVYTVKQALERDDLSESCRKILELEVKKNGIKYN